MHMADGTTQSQGVTYQTVTLTQGLADTLLKDDSPQTVLTEIWEFLNTALMTANLNYIDFLNIMDFVDLRFANMLMGIPENEWVNFRIYETIWDKDPTGKLIPVKTKDYPITELWDAIRAKVYIKCCNSRGGHLIKVLTEQRSSINQHYSESGVMRPDTQAQAMAAAGQPTQGASWRAI